MTKILNGSEVFYVGRHTMLWIVKKWRKSVIGGLVTRNTNDVKIKNSGIYKLYIFLLERMFSLLAGFSEKLSTAIEGSFILSQCLKCGRYLAAAFKGSFLCLVLEKCLEIEFNFANVKVHQLLVFLVVIAAPIVPTMVNAVLIFAALVFYLIDCARGNTSFRLEGTGFLVLSLISIFGFYAVTSLSPVSSVKIWLIYTVFMLFFFLVINTAATMDKLTKLAAAFTASGLLVSLFGIYQRFFGSNEGHAWLDDDMFTGITMRVYSTLENPNVLGEYLLLAIPICAALLWTRKTVLSKLFYGGTLGAMLICMVFTMSRGCWVGLLLAAAVFAVFTDWRLVAFGAVCIFLLPFMLPESIIMRFTSIGNVTDTSTSYRVFIWLGTLNMLKDFGIYGIGLGSSAYNKIYPFYSYSSIHAPHAHNIYLQLLCETGAVGLLTLILTVVTACKKMLLTRIQRKKTFPAILAISVIAGLLGFMLQGAFDYVWYNYRVFLMFWMVMALGVATRRVKAEAGEKK